MNLFGVSEFITHWDNLRVFNNTMQAIFLLSYDTQDFRASSDTSTIVPHVSVINHSRKKHEVLSSIGIHGPFINHYQI
jgi:hypothetical protein